MNILQIWIRFNRFKSLSINNKGLRQQMMEQTNPVRMSGTGLDTQFLLLDLPLFNECQ